MNWMVTNMCLLSSLDETIVQHGAEFNLGIHKYEGDYYEPKGHKYIRDYEVDLRSKNNVQGGRGCVQQGAHPYSE